MGMAHSCGHRLENPRRSQYDGFGMLAGNVNYNYNDTDYQFELDQRRAQLVVSPRISSSNYSSSNFRYPLL